MRIAIVCTYYPFPPSVGGVETIVRQVAIELVKRGHEVHIISSNLDVTTQKPVTNIGVEEREGITVHKLRPSVFKVGYAYILNELKETMAKIKPDIVHSHNLHPHLFQLARWKKKLGYRLIAELHYPAINLDLIIQKILLPLTTIALKCICRDVDAFIAHTQLEKQWLASHGVEHSKIHIIFTPTLPKKYLELNKDSHRDKTILFISRVVPKKGVHILIKAFSKIITSFPDVKLVIAGREDPKYKKTLEKLARKLRLSDKVIFKGFIMEEQKIELMSKSLIFCLPTLADYHPIVLLEAQALGIPVIATKVGAIPEIVRDGETGILVKPGDADELAKVLEMLLTDQDMWREMSLKAREWARSFTLSGVMDELERLYNNLVGEGNDEQEANNR